MHLLCAAMFVTGCTGTPTSTGESSTMQGTGHVSQKEAASNLFVYRQEATDLRDMARRRQLEADVLERNLGPDNEQVRRKRDLAAELTAAAEEVEQKARDLQRRVPHGMVQ